MAALEKNFSRFIAICWHLLHRSVKHRNILKPKILLAIVLACLFVRSMGQNCDVDFPGTAARNFSNACGGASTSNLTLGKNTYIGNGDTFTFDAPSVISINGNLDVNAQGSGKIIIPAGVTVIVDGNFQLDSKNSGCSTGNPCVFEIVVNGNANFTSNFQNNLVTLIWSGTGTVVVDDNFKNSSNGCMDCGAGGCPDFQVNSSDCDDDGSGCSGGDFCAKINACSSDVTVPQIFSCPSSKTVNINGQGCTQTVTWITPTASDNCMLSSFSASQNPATEFPLGTTTVTYTARDAADNTAACSFDITVLDSVAPVITGCPQNITVSGNASCQAVVNWAAPSFTDNCSGGTLTTTKASGSTFPKGVTTVHYTATDAAGNTATCSFNVNVIDTSPPVISGCPANIAVTANAACQAVVNWTAPSFTDNCAGGIFTASKSPGSTFNGGTTTVTYTAIDATGNAASCSFNVVVTFESLPAISNCPEDIILEGNEQGVARAEWTSPTAVGQCGEVTLTSSHKPGDIFSIGNTRIEYRATDEVGNTSYCHFNITVSQIEIDIGKIITPDDNGVNDVWTLANIEKYKDNKVVVVDRWGGLIFTATGYNNQNVIWRGTNRSGGLVPTGTYFYKISVRAGAASLEKSGFIELIR